MTEKLENFVNSFETFTITAKQADELSHRFTDLQKRDTVWQNKYSNLIDTVECLLSYFTGEENFDPTKPTDSKLDEFFNTTQYGKTSVFVKQSKYSKSDYLRAYRNAVREIEEEYRRISEEQACE